MSVSISVGKATYSGPSIKSVEVLSEETLGNSILRSIELLDSPIIFSTKLATPFVQNTQTTAPIIKDHFVSSPIENTRPALKIASVVAKPQIRRTLVSSAAKFGNISQVVAEKVNAIISSLAIEKPEIAEIINFNSPKILGFDFIFPENDFERILSSTFRLKSLPSLRPKKVFGSAIQVVGSEARITPIKGIASSIQVETSVFDKFSQKQIQSIIEIAEQTVFEVEKVENSKITVSEVVEVLKQLLAPRQNNFIETVSKVRRGSRVSSAVNIAKIATKDFHKDFSQLTGFGTASISTVQQLRLGPEIDLTNVGPGWSNLKQTKSWSTNVQTSTSQYSNTYLASDSFGAIQNNVGSAGTNGSAVFWNQGFGVFWEFNLEANALAATPVRPTKSFTIDESTGELYAQDKIEITASDLQNGSLLSLVYPINVYNNATAGPVVRWKTVSNSSTGEVIGFWETTPGGTAPRTRPWGPERCLGQIYFNNSLTYIKADHPVYGISGTSFPKVYSTSTVEELKARLDGYIDYTTNTSYNTNDLGFESGYLHYCKLTTSIESGKLFLTCRHRIPFDQTFLMVEELLNRNLKKQYVTGTNYPVQTLNHPPDHTGSTNQGQWFIVEGGNTQGNGGVSSTTSQLYFFEKVANSVNHTSSDFSKSFTRLSKFIFSERDSFDLSGVSTSVFQGVKIKDSTNTIRFILPKDLRSLGLQTALNSSALVEYGAPFDEGFVTTDAYEYSTGSNPLNFEAVENGFKYKNTVDIRTDHRPVSGQALPLDSSLIFTKLFNELHTTKGITNSTQVLSTLRRGPFEKLKLQVAELVAKYVTKAPFEKEVSVALSVTKKPINGITNTVTSKDILRIGPFLDFLKVHVDSTNKKYITKPVGNSVELLLGINKKYVTKPIRENTFVVSRAIPGRHIPEKIRLGLKVKKYVTKPTQSTIDLSELIEKDVIKPITNSLTASTRFVAIGPRIDDTKLNTLVDVIKYVTKPTQSTIDLSKLIEKDVIKGIQSSPSVESIIFKGPRIADKYTISSSKITKYSTKNTTSTVDLSKTIEKTLGRALDSSLETNVKVIRGIIQRVKAVTEVTNKKTAGKGLSSTVGIASLRPIMFKGMLLPPQTVNTFVGEVIKGRRYKSALQLESSDIKDMVKLLEDSLTAEQIVNKLVDKARITMTVRALSKIRPAKAVLNRLNTTVSSDEFKDVVKGENLKVETRQKQQKTASKPLNSSPNTESSTIAAYAQRVINSATASSTDLKYTTKNTKSSVDLSVLIEKYATKNTTNSVNVASTVARVALGRLIFQAATVSAADLKYVTKNTTSTIDLSKLVEKDVVKPEENEIRVASKDIVAFSVLANSRSTLNSTVIKKAKKSFSSSVEHEASDIKFIYGKIINNAVQGVNSGILFKQDYAMNYFRDSYVGEVRDLN